MDGYKNVLIIEDDLSYRSTLTDFLSAHGCNVSTADDGEMAMERLLFYKPNLVILDLILPKVEGLQVLSRIRSYPDPEFANIPVIVLSNISSEEQIKKAQDLKIEEFCLKSEVGKEEILKKVLDVLFQGSPPPSTQILDFTTHRE